MVRLRSSRCRQHGNFTACPRRHEPRRQRRGWFVGKQRCARRRVIARCRAVEAGDTDGWSCSVPKNDLKTRRARPWRRLGCENRGWRPVGCGGTEGLARGGVTWLRAVFTKLCACPPPVSAPNPEVLSPFRTAPGPVTFPVLPGISLLGAQPFSSSVSESLNHAREKAPTVRTVPKTRISLS